MQRISIFWKTAAVIPVIGAKGAREIAHDVSALKKLIDVLVMAIWSLRYRIKHSASEIDVGKSASYLISFVFHIVLSIVSSGIQAVGLGVIG